MLFILDALVDAYLMLLMTIYISLLCEHVKKKMTLYIYSQNFFIELFYGRGLRPFYL
jgi:hypothetical protein